MTEISLKTYLAYVLGWGVLRKFIPVAGFMTFAGYILFFAWLSLKPEKPALNFARQQVADKVVKKIHDDLRRTRGNIRTAVMIHFANDPTDYLSNQLRHQINTTGILNLEDMYVTEKFRRMFSLRIPGVKNHEAAFKYTKGTDSEGILWGKIDILESSKDGAICHVDWYLLDVAGKTTVSSGSVRESTVTEDKKIIADVIQSISTAKDNSLLQHTANILPWHVRFLIFLIFVLLFPIFTISFLQTMLRKRSNKVNAITLGSYTFIDAVMAFFAIGGSFSSALLTLFFVILTGLALGYNTYIMCFALRIGDKDL